MIKIKEGRMGGYRADAPWIYTFPNVWTWIVKELGVKSIIDVGCAEGHALEFFQHLGCDILGIDGCKYAYNHSRIKDYHIHHDYYLEPYIPKKKYEAAWSHDFVEHVGEKYTANYMASFNSVEKYVFLTFGPKGCPGHHHVNTQDLPYWIDLFAPFGFKPDHELTKRAEQVSYTGEFVTRDLVEKFPKILYGEAVSKGVIRDANVFSISGKRRRKRPNGIVFVRDTSS